MKEILSAKLDQHTEVQEALSNSNDKTIHENSPVDYFWGCGADGTGTSMVGKLWMEIREENRIS